MEDLLRELQESYQEKLNRVAETYLFKRDYPRTPLTWNQAKEHQGWENMHSYDEVRERLRQIQKNMDQRGVREKTIEKDAIEICERTGIIVPEHALDGLKRHHKRYATIDHVLCTYNITFTGWRRIDFILFVEYRMLKYLQNHRS